jgi:hypothetical protein
MQSDGNTSNEPLVQVSWKREWQQMIDSVYVCHKVAFDTINVYMIKISNRLLL